MSEWLLWRARRLSRRRFVERSLSTIFGALAALSVGRGDVLAQCANNCDLDGCSCVGPYDTESCGSDLCQGSACSGDPSLDIQCSYVSGFCPSGTACWSQSCGGSCLTCCDCLCDQYSTGHTFYCYCSASA
jgi:hypothetical protein